MGRKTERKEGGEGGEDGRGSEAEECLVCFSAFDSESHRPSTLPCGHSFCRSCLRHPSLSPAGVLCCPLCRALSWGTHTLRRETSSPQGAPWDRAPRGPAVPERPLASLTPQRPRGNRPPPATPRGRALLPPVGEWGLSALDEAWLLNRCALCCRRHSADSHPLDCRHSLCPRCLESLLALAAPGWVAFLYCPRCHGQTAVFGRPPAAHLPDRAAPEQRQSPAARPRTPERTPGLRRSRGCCGVGLPCTLL